MAAHLNEGRIRKIIEPPPGVVIVLSVAYYATIVPKVMAVEPWGDKGYPSSRKSGLVGGKPPHNRHSDWRDPR